MNVKKALAVSLAVILLAGCSSRPEKQSASSTNKPEKTKETATPEPSEETAPVPTPLSTDHSVLADKTLGIDFDLLENIPLSANEAKSYINSSQYAGDLNSSLISPDAGAFEVTVTDPDYSWLKENYTFSSNTDNPYLNQSNGSLTLSVSGEPSYENNEGYYADTTAAFRKNLTEAGYQSSGDHTGSTDASGYQINYYNYAKGGRTLSVVEVLLNGKLSTSVIEAGNPA